MGYSAIFPGQGSQSVGMLDELAEAWPEVVRDTLAEAGSLLDYDLGQLIHGGPEADLNRTQYTQPAMLAAGVTAWRIWQRADGPMPRAMAGHSLGEFSALVAAGSLDLAAATRLVGLRGELMQKAVAEGVGAVAAILGLDRAEVEQVCADAAQGQVAEPVNFNAPNQIVIAGHSQAVERAMAAARENGAKRAILLPVSVPVHSSLMNDAAAEFAAHIDELDIAAPSVPVTQNVAARASSDVDEIRAALRKHLNSGVLWSDSVLGMHAAVGDRFVEFGPGKVLAGLCRRIDRSLNAAAADSPAGMRKAKELVAA